MSPAMSQPQVDTTCGSLLRELQLIWDEVGESDTERDKMLLQLEQECLEVYRRKVDNASHARARLHQALADAESELASLLSALGDRPGAVARAEQRGGTLKEQVASIAPQLEELRQKREERARQFAEVKVQIRKILGEIAGSAADAAMFPNGEPDLSLRRLDEYHAQLQALLKEKSDRLHKVLEFTNIVHELCAVLGMDFFQTVTEVHPSLDESSGGQPKSISNETLDRLARTIHRLQDEKKHRMQKLQDLGAAMIELWNLMDTSPEEQQAFHHVTCNIAAAESEINTPGALTIEVIEQAEVEVERLDAEKSSKMKELVLKKRTELEEICRKAHMEPDSSTAPDKTNALIESGMVDATELLGSIEEQIFKAKEEAFARREILDKMDKWLSACEEESWLEDYNKDDNRYNASKGAHINLKRAERARATVIKLPALVESLTSRTRAWEDDHGSPFLYDGVPLLSMLDEYNFLRQEKEEEKRRLRDQKRLQEQFMNEQETYFGSRPSPGKAVSVKKGAGLRTNGSTPVASNRRLTLSGAIGQPGTPDMLLPRVNGVTPSRLGSVNGKDNKKDKARPAAPLNYVALSKDDMVSSAAAGGSHSPQVAGSNVHFREANHMVQAVRQPLSPVTGSPARLNAQPSEDGLSRSNLGNSQSMMMLKKSSGSAAPLNGLVSVDLENAAPRAHKEYSFEERRAGFVWRSGNSLVED